MVDANPRIISNLIVDQSSSNFAAVASFNALQPDGAPLQTVQPRFVDGVANPLFVENLFIQNVAPDVGLSAPFNSWFTLFGQFFDHGLDLLTKGGNGNVYIPLMPDDPLYVLGGHTNFMVLTRATNVGPVDAGPDLLMNTSDDIHNFQNTTTSWVDQNQTYTSHPSHQAFLREYTLDAAGRPMATGALLEHPTGGLATWGDIKLQAKNILGIELNDFDVNNVPLLATDEYGKLLLSVGGKAQIVTTTGLVEGNTALPVSPTDVNALRTNHAFLNDIAHHAAPKVGQTEDADKGPEGFFGDDHISTTYDNELLDAHYITGDGRGNENIALTSVHHIFHSEHNRLVAVIQA